MDIAIDQNTLKKRHLLSWGRWLLVLLACVLGLLFVRQLLAPAVSRSAIRTAVVERGAISTVVQAAGTVVPRHEWVLISPVASSISEVYLPLGAQVKRGEAILKVDSTRIESDIKRLQDQLRLKDLEITGILQQQQQQMRSLLNQQQLAAIDMEHQKVTLQRYEALNQTRIVTEYDYDLAALNAKKAELLVAQLTRQIADTRQSDDNQLEQREIEKQLLQQQLAEQEKLESAATLRATADGIITVLMNQLGQNVPTGAELVRISDVSGFSIEATLSDYYLHQVSAGMPVNIDTGSGIIKGTLTRILPAVDSGTLRLQIELDEPDNLQLKPNMRVDAGIVTQQRDTGLRVSNGIVFNGAGRQQVFVIQGKCAVRRQVEAGLQNSTYVEIVSGLAEGEEIIISDMSSYQHLEQVAVTN